MSANLGQLQVARFTALIVKYGEVPRKWFKYLGRCPRDHHSARFGTVANDPTCPLCGGTTLLYKDMPLPASGPSQGKIVLQQAFAGHRQRTGMEGAVGQLSYVDDDYSLMDGDRLSFTSRVGYFSENLERGAETSRILAYRPVASIDEVWNENGVDDGSGITWVDTAYVPKGKNYTVRYGYYLTYVVMDGSIHRRVRATDGTKFPFYCQVKLWQNEHIETRGEQI
jgi:hypothetical protein